ncbi:rhamnulokinase [Georgenia sp. MJ170]|uniref:rhamnulokinase n=1 Tax=Georgenia sunbinii TaxID=3117728 RepID=UPI002F262693
MPAGSGELHAAVDLGASSGRVILGRLSGGRLETTEVARFPNGAVTLPAAGRDVLHTDVLALYREATEGLRAAVREHGPLRSVGIDSWAVDYGLLAADGALLGNPVHYRDSRTDGVPERLFEHLPAAWLYARNGLQVQPFNTIFQLAAAAGIAPSRAGVGAAQLAAARRLLLLPDLFGHWLSGAVVAEVTNASTTGLLDVTSRRWSDDVLSAFAAACGTDVARLLPELVEPGTVVGRLRPAVGAGDAALVAVGSHDTASAVAALPMTSTDAAYISCGTWSLVGLELPAPVLTDAGRTANFSNELGLDGTVRYLRNVMGLWVLQECVRAWEQDGAAITLPDLLSAAGREPALACVIDIDDPTLLAPGDMPARVVAAARAAGERQPQTRAQITRCILDSLALAYRRTVRQAASLAGREVGVIHLVGGGSRNELLCRLTAEATRRPVVAGLAEGTAAGNLLVQAQATGALEPGLAALREVVSASSVSRRYDPSGPEDPWAEAERRLFPRRR